MTVGLTSPTSSLMIGKNFNSGRWHYVAVLTNYVAVLTNDAASKQVFRKGGGNTNDNSKDIKINWECDGPKVAVVAAVHAVHDVSAEDSDNGFTTSTGDKFFVPTPPHRTATQTHWQQNSLLKTRAQLQSSTWAFITEETEWLMVTCILKSCARVISKITFGSISGRMTFFTNPTTSKSTFETPFSIWIFSAANPRAWIAASRFFHQIVLPRFLSWNEIRKSKPSITSFVMCVVVGVRSKLMICMMAVLRRKFLVQWIRVCWTGWFIFSCRWELRKKWANVMFFGVHVHVFWCVLTNSGVFLCTYGMFWSIRSLMYVPFDAS